MIFQNHLEKKGKYLPTRSVYNRKKMPTMFEDGKLQISERVASSRRKETYEAALEIHGGGSKSAEVGLIDTVVAKCSKTTLGEVLSSSDKFKKSVMPRLYEGPLKNFEASEENMTRSVSVYYDGGIMGKRKYRQVKRNVSFKKSKKDRKSIESALP